MGKLVVASTASSQLVAQCSRQGGKGVSATSVVAGSKDRDNDFDYPTGLVETIPGKPVIGADRVEDLTLGYACSNVTALVYH
ncbi:hypothetical protein GN958_ATG20086 [Phytophthora infestans]|uniref:Uncharacterized protein n=1 Tax=Phytophthora infestans TaxID=4787 RepID=A0A8S9TQH0_PHYIN|nr:hypothetical protein GN958_ATG20086 [Phytophthora infestans]